MLLNISMQATLPPPTIVPALSPQVQLSLTSVFTALYAVLFTWVYIQLWMILYYGHRKLSYQTVFLFSCLLWAGLRTTLFSFYFKNAVLANNLSTPYYWLLYCFPVCLQYITLCLLVEFFSQVRAKRSFLPKRVLPIGCNKMKCNNFLISIAGCSENKNSFWTKLMEKVPFDFTKYACFSHCDDLLSNFLCSFLLSRKHIIFLLSASVVAFLVTNVICAVFEQYHQNHSESTPIGVLLTRVLINGLLFIVMTVALSVCLYKVSKTSAANMVLEAKVRTCYSLLALTCKMQTVNLTPGDLYLYIS